jgi:hypothetical protein
MTIFGLITVVAGLVSTLLGGVIADRLRSPFRPGNRRGMDRPSTEHFRGCPDFVQDYAAQASRRSLYAAYEKSFREKRSFNKAHSAWQ